MARFLRQALPTSASHRIFEPYTLHERFFDYRTAQKGETLEPLL